MPTRHSSKLSLPKEVRAALFLQSDDSLVAVHYLKEQDAPKIMYRTDARAALQQIAIDDPRAFHALVAYNEGVPMTALARDLGVSRKEVYRRLKRGIDRLDGIFNPVIVEKWTADTLQYTPPTSRIAQYVGDEYRTELAGPFPGAVHW